MKFKETNKNKFILSEEQDDSLELMRAAYEKMHVLRKVETEAIAYLGNIHSFTIKIRKNLKEATDDYNEKCAQT